MQTKKNPKKSNSFQGGKNPGYDEVVAVEVKTVRS